MIFGLQDRLFGEIAHLTKVEGTWGRPGRMDACVTEEQIKDNEADF